jgi:hypothetical protein
LNDFEIIDFSELKVRLDCYLLSQNSIASFTDNVQGNRIVDIHHEVRVFEACEFKVEFLVGWTNTIQAKRSSRHKIVIGCIFGNYCALNTDGLEQALQICGNVSVQLGFRDANFDSRVLKDEKGTLESGSHGCLLA